MAGTDEKQRKGGEPKTYLEAQQLTIGYGQPPVLLLHLELVAERARVWVLRIIHLVVLVRRLYVLLDIFWIGLRGVGHIWLPAAGVSCFL